MSRRLAAVSLWVFAAAQPTGAQDAAAAAASATGRNDYTRDEAWLCRPGRTDACSVDLTATVVEKDGTLKRESFAADPKAPIDCFYVYPTVSLDRTPNSDMTAGDEERRVIRAQFARLGSVCRTYAPLYRQVTLTALRAASAGAPLAVDRALGYNDVRDAWTHYLEKDNGGRGVVLIGHSQGSGVLTQLIRNEIDGKPAQARIVSALLLGSGVGVPAGKDVGGAFQHMPLCRSAKQTGCIVSYASFRATSPPPPGSRFGGVQTEGLVAACTNPAALAGGSAPLDAYLSSAGPGLGSSAAPAPWVKDKAIETPFVKVPGLLSARCVSNDKGSYLEVTVHADPSDPRTDDIVGDVVTNGQIQPSWGLHLIDVHLAMGNLIDVVRQQSQAYRKGAKKRGS
jgi:hypothetical protein